MVGAREKMFWRYGRSSCADLSAEELKACPVQEALNVRAVQNFLCQ